ncbi:phage tail protein I [Klebsiella pneumoniae]|uniref:Tail protein I n=1 Tax=Klebsiella pneumoniae subsp. pneumoniae (strain HS11286) TaxID=1125630 RepID=A0A0H3GWZ9_KLEPH|nr:MULTISPECIES: phage tail protein I [Klebsiella]YP_005228333.1 tail protein I [Klebsiella pneumoniae subsp. pneumoniae HS11286]UMX54183.1 phage tail protein I [Escherichia coli]AEW62731.1 tail protein I [Klebsiella pneumoniae subsp. pneumoniae HS11286]MBC4633021.1 phage tail protein I [Klebsiella pneumoniae]MCJ4251921.1 phage tail protein I [Klebsiella pneumoniae]MDY1656004.1 phage tail protein I [Klebsiella pneumoniae]
MATGSSVLEQRAAEACAVISDLSVPLRDLWNPWRCPVKFLPYLAWAFSVDRWEETWSETVKRQAVSDAFWIHQRKGTVAAVRRVIETLGYSMTLQEWWEVADPAGTFRLEIDLNDIGITESMIKELERIIGDTKPVSRHISRLTLVQRSTGIASIGAAVSDGEIITVYPAGYRPDDSIHYDGQSRHDSNYYYTG